MNTEEKAEIIFQYVDNAYSVPSYFEDDVREGIIKALRKIEREENRRKKINGK